PPYYIVPIRGREWNDRDKFLLPFAWKTHEHKEWFDSDGSALSLLSPPLLRNGPDVFSVIEDLFVFDVVSRVNGSLSTKQQFRISHMSSKKIRHVAGIRKKNRKHVSIRLDERVAFIEYIEVDRTIVSVNYRFNAIANVVQGTASDIQVSSVGIARGSRKTIHNPIESSVCPDDEIRVEVEQQERCQLRDSLPNVAAHQKDTLWGDIVGERNLGDVADGPRDQ